MHPLRDRADRRDQRVLVDPEVGPHGRGRGLGGEHQQRGAALRGLGDAGHRVGQPAALVHGEHRRPPGRARAGVGHRRRAALVPGRDERDARRAQRVRHVEVAAAHDAEGVSDAEPGERPSRRARRRSRSSLDQRQHPGRAARARRRSAAGRRRARRRWRAAGRGSAAGSARTCRRRGGRSGTGTPGRRSARCRRRCRPSPRRGRAIGASSASHLAHSTEIPGCAGRSRWR